MTEVSNTLRAARKLIEKPENWCKGSFARDPSGTAVDLASRNACAWCVWGAVGIAANMVDADPCRATKVLGAALPDAFRGVSDFVQKQASRPPITYQ